MLVPYVTHLLWVIWSILLTIYFPAARVDLVAAIERLVLA